MSSQVEVARRTDALRPGDTVRLDGGVTRTVRRVAKTGSQNRHREDILIVWYSEPESAAWPGGNAASAAHEWTVLQG
jgi:hypothetical protein